MLEMVVGSYGSGRRETTRLDAADALAIKQGSSAPRFALGYLPYTLSQL